jgi:hypothetical protein
MGVLFWTDNSRAGGVSVIVNNRLIPLVVQRRELAKMDEDMSSLLEGPVHVAPTTVDMSARGVSNQCGLIDPSGVNTSQSLGVIVPTSYTNLSAASENVPARSI